MAGSGRTLLQSLDFWAKEQPEKRVFSFEDTSTSLTYAELHASSTSLAEHLRSKLGLHQGDTCLLVYPPSLDFIVAFLACVRAGVIAVPAFPPDPRRLKKDLYLFAAMQSSCGAKIVLTSQEYNYAKKVSDIKGMFSLSSGPAWPELKWVITDALLRVATPTAAAAAEPFPAPALDDIAFLQYTSGSTSEPKGVMITHANLADNMDLIVTGLGAGSDTVVVSWLPQYHDMGLIGSYLSCMFCGGSGVYMSPMSFIRNPPRWMELISRHRATHIQAPNFAYGLVARKFLDMANPPQLDLSCVRHMINAAEPVDTLTIDSFYAVFESHGLKRGVVFPTYGLAENTVYVCSNGRARLVVDRLQLETQGKVHPVGEGKLMSWAYGVEARVGELGGPEEGLKTTSLAGCGRPGETRGLDLRIVAPDTCIARGEGEVGEIWLRGPSRAAGYWGLPEKTAEDFDARLLEVTSQDTGGKQMEASVDAGGGAGAGGSGATSNGRGGGGGDGGGGGGGEGGSAAARSLLAPFGEATAVGGGFLRTGDLGFLWEGELYICGRIKDLVIVRGRNHYPQDIEKTAETAVPGVLRGGCSGAFSEGVAGHARISGEALALVAEVNDTTNKAGVTAGGADAAVQEIRKAVSAAHGVSLFAVTLLRPRTVPKTTSGKIARTKCKSGFEEGTLDVWHQWRDDALAAREASGEQIYAEREEEEKRDCQANSDGPEQGDVREMSEAHILAGVVEDVSRVLHCEVATIATDVSFMELGMDSMEVMQLGGLLKERFKVEIDECVVGEPGTTIKDMVPILKAGGVIPERAVMWDVAQHCLSELDKRQSRKIVDCNVFRLSASITTGKFQPGLLAKEVETPAGSKAPSLVPRLLGLSLPDLVLGPLALTVFLLCGRSFLGVEELYVGLEPSTMATGTAYLAALFAAYLAALALVWAAQQLLALRADHDGNRWAVAAHFGVRVLCDTGLMAKEGERSAKPRLFAGFGHGEVTQLALVAMPDPFPEVQPGEIYSSVAWPIIGVRRALLGLRGTTVQSMLNRRQSTSVELTGPFGAASLAPAVALAMRTGADLVPCVALDRGGGGGSGGAGGGRAGVQLGIATAVAALAGKRPPPVALLCATPVRLPHVTEPSQEVVTSFAKEAHEALLRTYRAHAGAYYDGLGAGEAPGLAALRK